MKSTSKKLSGSVIELTVTLDEKEFEEYIEHAKEDFRRGVSIKGFRKGNAPKEIADRAINPEAALENAISTAVRKTLHAITEENEWILIDQPKIELKENEKDNLRGLNYIATITTFPEVKLGDYRKIAKKIRAEKKPIQLDETEIEKSLEWLRKSRSISTLVTRPAKRGDLVDINLETEVDGKKLAGGELTGERFILGESHFIPGFDEKLENHSSDETITFDLTAPKNYWKEDLRDKTLHMKVHLNEVNEQTLPELNDAFIEKLGKDFKTMDDVKKSIREGLTTERELKENERIILKTLDEIGERATIDIPKVMIEKTMNNMFQEFGPHFKESGKSADEIRESLRPGATKNVRNSLVISEIAKVENLTPTPEEVGKEIELQNMSGGKIDPARAYDYSYGIVQNKKVFEFLENLS